MAKASYVDIVALGHNANRSAFEAGGGGGGTQEVFVQPTQPTATTPYLWIQTGLGPGGTGFTFWFNDGL